MTNAWANIESSPRDREIARINKMEKSLGPLTGPVQKIRELITRLEVCHFKYDTHLEHIKASIEQLKPVVDPDRIGDGHIRHGEKAWIKDPTGRSLLGQRYLRALNLWLGEAVGKKTIDPGDTDLDQNVQTWLGQHTPDKDRLVRLLIARLLWDEGPYEALQEGGIWEPLEQQIIRMDICHHAFPENLDRLLPGIGLLAPVEHFTGCGIINQTIHTFFRTELLALCDQLAAGARENQNKRGRIKVWLTACLAKTVKAQLGLRKSLPFE